MGSRVVELTIESLAAGGNGVGRADGLVVFVPRAAPGDSGRVRFEETGGRFAHGGWETLERLSPVRVDPPCPHYVEDRCGGCQLQHIGYESQLTAKADIIRDAIQRIGKRPAESPPVRASPRQWRYRRKLTLALRPRGGSWIAGLHPYDAPGRIFDLRDCPITDERVLAVWAEIRAAASLLPEAKELRGAVRIGGDGDAARASFLLEGGEYWPTSEQFFDAVPSLAALWWRPENRGRRVMHARAPVAVWQGAPAPSPIPDEENADARIADASFAQVNAEVAAELQEHVVSLALAHSPRHAIDAYSGRGDTAVALAIAGITVTAIELDRDGAADGARRLAAPSRMIEGRVEDFLRSLLPTDLVIVNPPRAGLDKRVTNTLMGTNHPRPAIIYVSCDPATLARDVARLRGYHIASMVGFDMFPQTAHVETVCELVPEPT
jgi:23S rRNA (uracil1939-C5)-methyltransferase